MRWEGEYAPDEECASTARHAVAAALSDTPVADDLLLDVLLVVGELVSNAIRHAATDFTVTVSVDGDGIRVEVFDADTRPPALLAADLDATSGRGMHIVAAAATAWGYEADERDGITGKTVWAQFDLPPEQ